MDKEYYTYDDCIVEPANGDYDAPVLYKDMRTIDMLEIIGLGNHPRLALEKSYEISDVAWTLLTRDYEMIGSFGIARSGTEGIGVPWLLGTHRMYLIKRTFIKHSKEWINRLFSDKYEMLTNYIMNENAMSIRWLKWLGASFSPCDIEGYQQFTFYKK